MRILALGVDHRSAPTAVREALAFDGKQRQCGLDALKANAPDSEFILLSTCNRVELYAAAEADPPDADALAGFLAQFQDVPVAMLEGHLVARHDEAAVAHLFRVAAGLESLVPGEGQILGQVHDAYKLASDCKSVGPILHHVFQRALRVGKWVRQETDLNRGRCSVASVAVDVARDVSAQQPAPASAPRCALLGRHRRGHLRPEVPRRPPAARSPRSATFRIASGPW